MNLDEFIKNTLISIRTSISEANKELTEKTGDRAFNLGTTEKSNVITFDIAVTAENSKSGNGEAGIKVAGLRIGGDLENEDKTSHVSRIRFSVHPEYNHMS